MKFKLFEKSFAVKHDKKKLERKLEKNQLAIDFYLLSILCIYYLKFIKFSNQAIIFFADI